MIRLKLGGKCSHPRSHLSVPETLKCEKCERSADSNENGKELPCWGAIVRQGDVSVSVSVRVSLDAM